QRTDLTAGQRTDLTAGQRTDLTAGQRTDLTAGQRTDLTAGQRTDLLVGVNGDFLLDALDAADGPQLVLELDGPITPLAVRRPDDEDTFSILMPIRL
ncbi:hypothetical protein ABZ491_16330, partial [Micromonospora rifamycinica]